MRRERSISRGVAQPAPVDSVDGSRRGCASRALWEERSPTCAARKRRRTAPRGLQHNRNTQPLAALGLRAVWGRGSLGSWHGCMSM